MAASGIGDFNLILGAEINPSVSQLKADIKTIAERLSKSPLKITIGANVSKSAPQIRADFAKISARLSKNPPRVTIGASVAPSTRQIKTDLNAIVEKINKNPPKVKLGATASGQKNTGSSASQSTTSSSNTKTLTAETTEYYNALTRVNTLLTQVTSMQQNWTAARNGNASGAYGNLNGYASELQALIQKLETGSMSADEFKNSFARISSNVSAARTAIKSAGEAMRETTAAQAGQTAQTKLLTATSTEYHTALKQIDTLLAQVTNAQTRWTAAKTGKSRNEYNNLNTYANILQRLREEVVTLASADARAGMEQDAFNKRMAAARAGVTSATTSIRNAGEATQSWGDRIGSLSAKFGTWFSITRVIMAGVRVIKQMVSNVVELDTAMTELKKVTEESDSTYEKFLTKATNRAKELGAALTDVVSATADFARLGFNLDDSAQLADAAIVYKNVGDGIEDIGDASESIISTMQAFGVEADDVMSIVDKFNEVGNNYAISSKGVGDALLRSASAMKAAGNSLDETIALAAAANTVVQDPEKVGTALKTLSMYLRAAKTEAEDAGESTEGMANSVSELREELLSLTGNKVDIQLDENTFKGTFQIMQELSAVWHELTDVSQANILELIGGKRNSNVVAALLENFSVANNAVKTSAESAGSAWQENLKVLDSIQGRINIFKATFQEFSKTAINGDFLKSVISTATQFLQLVNSVVSAFGGLKNTIIAIGGVIAGLKVDKILSMFTKLGQIIMGSSFVKGLKATRILFSTLETDVKGGAAAASASLEALGGAASIATVAFTALAAAIGIAILAYQHHKQAIQEQRNAAIEAADEAANSTASIIELSDKYAQLSEEVKTNADVKDDLINTEDELIDKLDIEQSHLNELIKEYGNYKDALKAASLEKLAAEERDLRGGLEAKRNTLLDTAKPSGIDQVGMNHVHTTWDDEDRDVNYKAFDALVELGYTSPEWRGTNGVDLYFTDMDLSTVEGVISAYEQLGKMIDAVVDKAGTENAVYNMLYAQYGKVKSALDEYRDGIYNLNVNLAAQQIAQSALNEIVPRTQDQFEECRQSIIDAAVASDRFEGSAEDITKAIDDVLSRNTAYTSFMDELARSTEKAATVQAALDGLKQGFAKSVERASFINGDGGLASFMETMVAIQEFNNWIDGLSDDDKEIVYTISIAKDTADWTLKDWNNELQYLKNNTNALDILRAKVEGVLQLSQPPIQSWDELNNKFDDYTAKLQGIAEVQAAITDGFTMSADAARKFAATYPEILKGATATADGQIQLNSDVVNSFLQGKEAELKGNIDTEIQKLNAEKADLQIKKTFAQAEIDLAKQVGADKSQIDKEVAEYKLKCVSAASAAFIKLGADDANAWQLSMEAMAGDTDEFNRIAAEVCTDVDGNFDAASYNAMLSVYKSMQTSKQSVADFGSQVHESVKALLGLDDKKIAGSTELINNASPGTFYGDYEYRKKQISYNPAGKFLGVSQGSSSKNELNKRIKEASDHAFEKSLLPSVEDYAEDFIYSADDLGIDDFVSGVNAEIENWDKRIAEIDSQIEILEALRNKPLEQFDPEYESKQKQAAKDAKSAEKAAEDAQKAAEELAKAQGEERLTKLKNSISDVKSEIEGVDSQIDLFKQILDVTSENDFPTRLNAYSNILTLVSDKAGTLYTEFERLRNIMPQNSEEAQELATRMSELGDDILSNAQDIQEYSTALDMVLVDAVNSQVENLDTQISESEKVLQRNIDNLTGHTLKGRSGVFDASFLIPSLDDDVIERKRKENEKLLELEKWLQKEIYNVKKRYSDMSSKEAEQEAAAAASKIKSSVAAAEGAASQTSQSASSSQSASTSTVAQETGSFVLTDVTDYDSLIQNMRNVLAAKISNMVAEFTDSDWQDIVQAHPLSAFTLDEESWSELQKQIDSILENIKSTQDQDDVRLSDVPAANVLQDALNSLVADTVNTQDSSWVNLTEGVRNYIQQTYGLAQADWEALCASSPLIAASLKLTGENSWAARDAQLNGDNGIMINLMKGAQGIVGTTILPAPSYNKQSYTQLGQNMGNTIVDAMIAVLDGVEIKVEKNFSSGLSGTPQTNPQGVTGRATGSSLVATAQKYLGTPYVWGGTSPNGFDCSGLMQYIFKENGIDINRVADDQWRGQGQTIKHMKDLRPGDMVFFENNGDGEIDHVGMYVGGGQMIHAPNSNSVVKYTDIQNNAYYNRHFVGGKRLVAYADGTSDGAIGGEALVGEEGRELAILPNGQSVLLGKNGAEIVDIPKGTQIYTNKDTEEILKYTGDKIDGRTIPKYAGGTVNPMDIAAYIRKNYPEITDAGIAAILGNIEQESGFDPKNKTVEAYGSGSSKQIARWGLFQLDDTRIPNWSNIVNNGTWQQQIDTALAEGRYQNSGMGSLSRYNVWSNILTNPNMSAADAAREFDKLYERSDGQSRETRAANAEKYLAQLASALQENTGTLEANTAATQSQEKTISEKIMELTKTPSSYSKDFLDKYMNYVEQRKEMLNVISEARKYGEFAEADGIEDSLMLRDLEETFAMQLNLYTESAKKYQEQYEELEALYYEYLGKGADESVLSEIITAMSEVSAKIDEASEKWTSAVENMGESFTAVIDRATAKYTEAIANTERNIQELEHLLEITHSPDQRSSIYRSIEEGQEQIIKNYKAVMDAAHNTAAYQRGERDDNPTLYDGTLKDYAAREGKLVRSYYINELGKFGDYENWFNSNGTINTEVLEKSIADFDDDLKQKAIDFANFLSVYKVVWANDAAQQFTDITSKYSTEEINTWFYGDGDISQAGWDMVENAADEFEKNRISAFLQYQSALKKIYNENKDPYLEEIEQRYQLWQSLVDEAKDALGEIRDLYSTLKDAAEEYAKTGFISIDSFEAISEYGVEYMAFLRDENGQLVINKKTIDKVIAARTQQLAVTTALNYVERIGLALEKGNAAELEHLTQATDVHANTTKEMVYAQLAWLKTLGLSDAYYEQALTNLDNYFSVFAAAQDGITNGFEESLSGYDSKKDAIENILDLVMSLIKYEKDQEVEALNDQIDRYREIIDAKKESLALSKEENDYNKTVADKVKEIADIQFKISQLSLDDSREAQAEKKSLEQDLADKQEELADYQSDYAYDKTTEMLDKSLEAYEDEKKKEIEAVEESVSSTEKVYQLAIERLQGDWWELYADILNWNYDAGSSIESEIVDRWKLATEAVKEYGSYLEAYAHYKGGTWNSDYTQFESSSGSTEDEFVVGNHTPVSDSVDYDGREADRIISQMRKNSIAWLTDIDNRSSLESENAKYARDLGRLFNEDITIDDEGHWHRENGDLLYSIDPDEAAHIIVSAMKSNSSRWGSASKSERDRLADLNDQYASMLGNILRREVTRDGDGVWWVNGKRLYDVYHKGGIVGGKSSLRDSEVMSVLEKGELVLDKAKKDSLYEYVDLSTYILKRFGSALNENSDLIKTSVMANSFDKLNRSVSNSVPEMNNSGSSYVVEKLEVNSPIQVIEKLDKTEIRRHARTIGEIAAGSIKEGFDKRGIRATSQQL